MTKKDKNNQLFNKIYLTYCKDMWIHVGTGGFYSYIKEREVCVPAGTFSDANDWAIFALLHEIGHIMTNTTSMKRCLQEYFATQWAIEESKKYGFKIPKSYISVYQEYIWRWRETGLKHKAKSIPTQEELTLVI